LRARRDDHLVDLSEGGGIAFLQLACDDESVIAASVGGR